MSRIYLNRNWLFRDLENEEVEYETVTLPHTCKELPFHYFDEKEYQMISEYKKEIDISTEWEGKALLLTIDGAAHVAKLYVNDTLAEEHFCGYTAFTTDISQYVKFGEKNELRIVVNSKENQNVPPFGYVVDYMTYGGIYREVYLDVKDKYHMESTYLYATLPKHILKRKETVSATLNAKIQLTDLVNASVLKFYYTNNEKERVLIGQKEVTEKLTTASFDMKNVHLWDVEHPYLYDIEIELTKDDVVYDTKTIRFGFRKVEFKKDGFFLNDRKLKIRGLNRHQSYPYVGYAMPESMQKHDADILKNELGCNAVRTSHYPQSHHFIDRCDEIGLLVFTELPGWQHIGDEEWKNQAVQNVREMITQYRNHTSIILWGVRINESMDDDGFYIRTNVLAHELDYRQTGGVRAHKNSHLFEDVYTYNDFVHNGTNKGCEKKKKVTSDKSKPYLISEYNGHMFPTKIYDAEEHRLEHALRHARVLDSVAGESDISGSFGWCMFDYNTHKDFGSGDRICYHGVMDMFRNPKLAASVYASFQKENVVLELSSSMDIGEHPASNRGPTYIFTNADSVRMYKNDKFIKEYYPKDSKYKNLPNGPILIDDFIGEEIHKNEKFPAKQADLYKKGLNYVAVYGYDVPLRIKLTYLRLMLQYHMKPEDGVKMYNKYVGDWGGSSTCYRFEAIVDGKVVKIITKEPMHNMHIEAKVDHKKLVEKNTYDVAEVRLRALDENDNQMFFYHDSISVEVEGPIELIGPSVLPFRGGMTGLYVKTIGESGLAKIRLKNEQLEEIVIDLEVEGV